VRFSLDVLPNQKYVQLYLPKGSIINYMLDEEILQMRVIIFPFPVVSKINMERNVIVNLCAVVV